MGTSLSNITLRGVKAPRVAGRLRDRKRSAAVSAEVHGCTIVCDRECDEQDPEVLAKLGAELSKDLRCVALAVMVHDSDVLILMLFEHGRLLMDYNSAPAYFENVDPQPPSGADGAALCRAFGSSRVMEVQTLLTRWSDPDDEGGGDSDADELVFEEMRLAGLAALLGIPEVVAQVSYSFLQEGGAEDLGDSAPTFEEIK